MGTLAIPGDSDPCSLYFLLFYRLSCPEIPGLWGILAGEVRDLFPLPLRGCWAQPYCSGWVPPSSLLPQALGLSFLPKSLAPGGSPSKTGLAPLERPGHQGPCPSLTGNTTHPCQGLLVSVTASCSTHTAPAEPESIRQTSWLGLEGLARVNNQARVESFRREGEIEGEKQREMTTTEEGREMRQGKEAREQGEAQKHRKGERSQGVQRGVQKKGKGGEGQSVCLLH